MLRVLRSCPRNTSGFCSCYKKCHTYVGSIQLGRFLLPAISFFCLSYPIPLLVFRDCYTSDCNNMSLTPDQVKLIKATVPVLKEHGTAITSHFYGLLLKENPSLNGIFNQSNQKTGHQAGALAGSLYAYASHIDDLGVLSPAVEKICHKHASMYVQPEHYDVVGTYLLRAMGDVLGEALTPEILEAWGQAYWQLANIVSDTSLEHILSPVTNTTYR
jgi:hemoglobin-like flavoprotein